MTKINSIVFSALMISMINSQVFSKEIIEDEVNVEIRSDRSSSFQSVIFHESEAPFEDGDKQFEGGVKQYSRDLRKKDKFLRKLYVPSLMRAFLINNVFKTKLVISEEGNNKSFFNIKIFSKNNNKEDVKVKRVIKKLFSAGLKLNANSLTDKQLENINEEAENLLSERQMDYVYKRMNTL